MQLLTTNTFDDALAEAPGLVLVDFYADWCGPCKTLGPILESLAPEYEGRVAFVKVDADKSRPLMDAFGVKSLPTLLLLAPRRPGPGADVVGYSVGAKPPEALRKLLDRALNPKPGLLKRIFGGG